MYIQKRREKRKASAFHFIEKGSIVKKAELIREKHDDDENKTKEE